MKPDRGEDPSIGFTLGLGPGRSGRPMPKLDRTKSTSGPAGQLGGVGIAERVMKPDRSKPALPLRLGGRHRPGPLIDQRGHSLYMGQPLGADPGPRRHGGSDLGFGHGAG